VSVNSQTVYRNVEYYQALAGANNASGPVWQEIAVSAGGTNVTGHVLVPQTPQGFYYDADGNLTGEGLWTNTWSAENRLVKAESSAALPAAAKMREEWTHLPDGRWIQRIVSTNNGTAYFPAWTNRFVWDGQVLLAILDHTNGLVMSFLRGLDLSGSAQGAGGVGGLIAVSSKTNGMHFAAYDGNGNVAALVSAADGSVSARYEYGPFGEVLRASGPMAKANPIQFSTQYADDVTGDPKYLHRDYTASTGRWKSRDPIEEEGGLNVYAFTANNSISSLDLLGRATLRMEVVTGTKWHWNGAGEWSQPYWAGEGLSSVGSSSAYSLVDLGNSLSWEDDFYKGIYCNTVYWNHPDDPQLTSGNAGSIWAFLKDDCGGRFSISGTVFATVGGSGPQQPYASATVHLGSHPSVPVMTVTTTAAQPVASNWLLFQDTVDIPPGKWVMVAMYDLTLGFRNRSYYNWRPSYGFGEWQLIIRDVTKVQ
jgi:RHS repeat-associated protein